MTSTKDPRGRPGELAAGTAPTDPGANPGDDLSRCALADLITVGVRQPAPEVCVVSVSGELDASTVPLLDSCVHEQILAAPTHLIVDLESVQFMGSTGLTCLLQISDVAEQAAGVQLHLAGLVTRAVARPLEVTEVVTMFDTYATVTDALAAVAS